jgi:hypothetical protein
MPLTWDDITGKVNKHIIPRLVDNVYKSSPVFTRLRTRNAERFEGGTSIRHPIAFAELNGGAFQRGGTFNISYVQTDTALEVVPKYYYVNITLFGTDNVLARGPEAAMNYVESKMVNASGKMAKLLGTDIFLDGTGVNSGTINLDGFDQALDNGGLGGYASYGGITRTDLGVPAGTNNQGINSYVNTLPIFNMQAMQLAYGAAWFGNEHIDLIATTQLIWNLIWNKILPQQRFMEESTDVAKIGFQSLRWNGASVTVDQYCPAGKIFGLNTKYIQFWISTLPKYQFGFTGFKEAQNTDDVAGQYLFAGNILIPAPRLFFKLNGVVA